MTRLLALLALLLALSLAVPAHAAPLSKAQCRANCAAFLELLDRTAPSECIVIRKNGRAKVKAKCRRAVLIRKCRHGSTVCVTTTTTTTTTTTSMGPTITPPMMPPTICPEAGCQHYVMDFTNGLPGEKCGEVQDANGAPLKDLTCGGLNIGGGASTVAEGPTPDGSTSRFELSCAQPSGGVCSISPYPTPPAPVSADPDCTVTGCNFGTPLPIPNPALPNLTTCVLNTWATDATGSVNLDDGTSSTSVPLSSDIYITGNAGQPCPRCVTGACDRGPRAGMACASANSNGLTRDCLSGGAGAPPKDCQAGTQGHDSCIDGAHVGIIGVNLTPLSTGAVSMTTLDGNFCPHQGGTPGTPGCFGVPACRGIQETGAAAGPIMIGTPASARLAAIFCIASTSNGLVNFAADLPGPGAVTLPGTFTVRP